MSATVTLSCIACQAVAATRPAHRLDDLVPAQLAEQLLQVGQRNGLALADARQRDGSVALAEGQIDHRSYSKTAFGGQTHHNPGCCPNSDKILLLFNWPVFHILHGHPEKPDYLIDLVKYSLSATVCLGPLQNRQPGSDSDFWQHPQHNSHIDNSASGKFGVRAHFLRNSGSELFFQQFLQRLFKRFARVLPARATIASLGRHKGRAISTKCALTPNFLKNVL
jgi:hypothetical protein